MAPKDSEVVEISATTEKKGDESDKKTTGKKGEEEAKDTLSEEDKELKERLETCVSTLLNENNEAAVTIPIRLKALDMIVNELRSSTSSMTSVPKPLKFLRPHFSVLKNLFNSITGESSSVETQMLGLRARLADVLSVLAMTMGKPEDRESLHFKLAGAKDYEPLAQHGAEYKSAADNLGSWGHEYVRSLAGEIGEEYAARVIAGSNPEEDEPFADLLRMVDVIVPFHVNHNAEAEAVDLLIEVQRLKNLLKIDTIDEKNYQRICLYLVKTADYMSDPDDLVEMLETAYEIYRSQHQFYDALRVALRMARPECITDLLKECEDPLERKQMCFLLGRHRVNYEVDDSEIKDEDAWKLNEYVGNEKISEFFLKLAQDLDVMDPKTPEDIYKSHLAETGGFSRRRDIGGAQVDSARANLASTYVNAFVNAGFCQDKLMTPDSEWLYKNKDHGMLAAAASLGSILLWNVDDGLTQIDKFLYSSEDYVKAGAALAIGIVSSGVRNEADPALALLAQYLEEDSDSSHVMKCAACTGLGIAYAGSAREDVMEILLPVVEGTSGGPTRMMEVCLAGLALGMIYVGSCDDNVGGTIVQRLMEATEEELNHSHARFLCLGLALLFLGQMEKADAMIEALRTIEHSISKYAVLMLETAAYAGSGNVLKVQEMLHQCTEHLTEDAEHQMAAVLGIGLITMGEDVGSEMALRTFDHLLHYCELPIKRAVPLSLAALNISNPDFTVIDQLSRLSHDPDTEIAQNAIIALGVVSAGTNNSRVAGLLRQLSEFYSKEASHVFCVRIAQGLLHMGKGLMTLNPFHSDGMLMCGPALGGMLVLLHSCLDLKSTILDKSHYLLYYLTCAMTPRMLITVDENVDIAPVTVRVGQAVETVGQAGKPKRITGFQTHTTPVLLATKERAELGTEEFLSVSSVLEGVVIVKKNPDYETEEKK
ncbi:26S proteasome regulatory subunit N1 [Fistulifera solaris]|uniref:26S proteasome regulatory subunit N1 n=1 Tax=Fistulifera solaris TaxID=1519565 RepID=A0A1Z5KBF7_FISSO|nr:26S proteasome regulatory subunit N1 [Fistulifera solaris]|eukprot:GAX23623.1 26S proteasome regulatory subunit N1 [Fistulifera solaris]